jgi:H+-transporting ATPase
MFCFYVLYCYDCSLPSKDRGFKVKPSSETPVRVARLSDRQTMKDVEVGLNAVAVAADDDDDDSLELTNLETGLTDEEVAKAILRYGINEIPVPEAPLYAIFLRQLTGFLPLLIELAAILAIAVEDYIDFGIIVGILLINACLGFREEYHAKKALDELSKSLDSEIGVRRNGKIATLLTKELVPGDIILLVGGVIVPADTKWIRGDKMQIDTAPLTGEPLPRKMPSEEYGDVILSGTTVVAGECYGQVVHTGTKTEIGKAQADVFKDKSVIVVSVFQEKILTVVKILVISSLAVVIAVLLVEGIAYNGFDDNVKQTVLDALSIMIASIPVALPLVLQVNLALGASFLAKKHHAIVTSIPALQDIASMSMLCSDKTGTLVSFTVYNGMREKNTVLTYTDRSELTLLTSDSLPSFSRSYRRRPKCQSFRSASLQPKDSQKRR